jgi:hypothetical protein
MAGELVIPFIESVAEESRPAVTTFIQNTGATNEDIASYKTLDEFMTGYKPKTPSAPEWNSALPDEEKAFVNVKGWKNPVDTIKGYRELEKLVGHEKIAMPKKDKSGNYEPGELERVMTQLGRPVDPKDYKVSANFKLPDGVQIDEKLQAEFNAKLHKAGFLPHQYSLVMDELANMLNRGTAAIKDNQEKSFNDATLALRTKWGMAYEEKTKLANSVLRNFAADQASGLKLVEKYGNDPAVIELMANIGSGLSEESLTRVNMLTSMLTPESAKLEIDKINREHAKELLDANHPEHKYWLDKRAEYYRMANAGQQS